MLGYTLHTFPVPIFERTHRKYIFSMAPTVEIFLLLQYMYHGKQLSLAFQCIFSIVKIIQQSYKSVYNWKFQLLWYIFRQSYKSVYNWKFQILWYRTCLAPDPFPLQTKIFFDHLLDHLWQWGF